MAGISFQSTPDFTANGHYYVILACLITTNSIQHDIPPPSNLERFDFQLDSKFIELFQYETCLNSLCASGHLVYIDNTGTLMNFIQNQNEMLYVAFAELKPDSDGNVQSSSIVPGAQLNEMFIIDKIRVVGRNGTALKYQLDLISSNWFNLQSKVNFSNYNTDAGTPIFDILKHCLQDSHMKFDAKCTFNDVQSNVKLKYITSVNDTCDTVFKYLTRKMYYDYAGLDDSMKFAYYDMLLNAIKLFDVKNPKSYGFTRSVMIDLVDTQLIEMVSGAEYVNIGSVNGTTKTKTYTSMFDAHRHTYSYAGNSFSKDVFEQKSLAQYFNAQDDSTKDVVLKPKMHEFAPHSFRYFYADSLWRNERDVYYEMLDAMLKDNSIALEINGQIQLSPSAVVCIGMPESKTGLTTDQENEYNALKRRFQTITGNWFTAKVKHSVSPMNHTYRQTAVVFRNFVNA